MSTYDIPGYGQDVLGADYAGIGVPRIADYYRQRGGAPAASAWWSGAPAEFRTKYQGMYDQVMAALSSNPNLLPPGPVADPGPPAPVITPPVLPPGGADPVGTTELDNYHTSLINNSLAQGAAAAAQKRRAALGLTMLHPSGPGAVWG